MEIKEKGKVDIVIGGYGWISFEQEIVLHLPKNVDCYLRKAPNIGDYMLTSKQKAILKSIAMTRPAIFQVGKEVSDNLIIGLNAALEAHELIKISVLKTVALSLESVAEEIADLTKSQIVQIIGRNIVLFKRSKKQLIKI